MTITVVFSSLLYYHLSDVFISHVLFIQTDKLLSLERHNFTG